jgi:hypothetical protein
LNQILSETLTALIDAGRLEHLYDDIGYEGCVDLLIGLEMCDKTELELLAYYVSNIMNEIESSCSTIKFCSRTMQHMPIKTALSGMFSEQSAEYKCTFISTHISESLPSLGFVLSYYFSKKNTRHRAEDKERFYLYQLFCTSLYSVCRRSIGYDLLNMLSRTVVVADNLPLVV